MARAVLSSSQVILPASPLRVHHERQAEAFVAELKHAGHEAGGDGRERVGEDAVLALLGERPGFSSP
eukprot:scaffold307_cov390-Prasinococcus_capsulatus_cf.AAC.26